MSKVIIAGSRNFNDYLVLWEFLERKLNWFVDFTTDSIITEIVFGTAGGADRLGERYARDKGLPVKRFPADWNTYGKAEGHIRNRQMAEYADVCVVFWDGESRGSADMIVCAKELKLPTIVVKYKVRRFQIFNLGGKRELKMGNNAINHLKTILVHKYWVGKYCFKAGLYWTDNYDEGITAIKMPYECVIEMVCDYLGAARAYLGKDFSYKKEWEWWVSKRDNMKMHEWTKDFVGSVLRYMANTGNDEYINGIAKDHELKKAYEGDCQAMFCYEMERRNTKSIWRDKL